MGLGGFDRLTQEEKERLIAYSRVRRDPEGKAAKHARDPFGGLGKTTGGPRDASDVRRR